MATAQWTSEVVLLGDRRHLLVSVRFAKEEVASAFEEDLARTIRQMEIPGFRKGKAPRERVLKQSGPLILRATHDRLVRESCDLVIQEATKARNLAPPSQDAEVHVTDVRVLEDGGMNYEASFLLDRETPKGGSGADV